MPNNNESWCKQQMEKLEQCIENIKSLSAKTARMEQVPCDRLFEHLYEQELLTISEMDRVNAILGRKAEKVPMHEQTNQPSQQKEENDEDKMPSTVDKESDKQKTPTLGEDVTEDDETTEDKKYQPHYGSITGFLLEEEKQLLKELC